MNKLYNNKILVGVALFVCFVLLCGFTYGFIICMDKVNGIVPSDQDLAFFGVGLCSLPTFILFVIVVHLMLSLFGDKFDWYSDQNKDDSISGTDGKDGSCND